MATKDWNGFKKNGDTYIPNDATARAGLQNKVDKVSGKGLSTNDYSNADKAKVAGAVQWADAEGYVGKNKLKYNAWTKTGVRNGTMVFENNGVTLTATGNDCYTGYDDNFSFPHDARIPVEEGKQIIFSWDINDNDGAGTVVIFPNGGYEGLVSVANTAKQAVYTPANGITFVTFRLGVATSGNTVHYKDLMFRSADTPSNFVKSFPDNTELFPRSEQAMLGAKNLLDISKRSANTATFSSGGVTFNDDGTIVVNGVVSAEGSIVGNMPVNIPNGWYKISGCTGGSSNTYLIDIYETQWTNRAICYDGDTDFELTQNVTHYMRIWLKPGTYNNLVFKPMIRLATDTDPTYAPYAMTNKELTEKKVDKDFTVISSVDLDDYKSNGKWRLNGSITHGPGPNYGFCEVLAYGTSIRQFVFADNSTDIYTRIFYNNAWGVWYKITQAVNS